MIFTVSQVEELLSILEYHFLFTISTNYGTEALNKQEIDILSSFGVNINEISKTIPQFDRMYLLGKLTGILSEPQVNTLNFDDFLKYIKTGQYQSLTHLEKIQLDIARRKTYTHLRGLKEKAKQQFESTILSNESNYQNVVKEAMRS